MSEQPTRCDACRVLDEADDVVDGHYVRSLTPAIRHERVIVDRLKKAEDRFADGITTFAGSMRFVYLHTAWFAVWVLLNIGALSASLVFDKFPFGLLTMIVSLEAIFLSTFVMISQNRQSQRADIRSQLDYETNLRAEIWSVHIGHKLDIDARHVEEIVKQAIEESHAVNAATPANL
jgi:uncharacterized membrane protein